MKRLHAIRRNHPQRGFVTIAAVLILVTGVIFWLQQTYDIIGLTSKSNELQSSSVAAFFLAESGVETAKATIQSALDVDNYTADTCINLKDGVVTLAVGNTFKFISATCGGSEPCGECTVVVKGASGSAERTIEAMISTVTDQGDESCGATPSLSMTAKQASHGVFTNLAYRAKTITGMCGGGGGSNANIGSCNIELNGTPFVNCAPVTEGWGLEGQGTTNVSGLGIFTTVSGLSPDTVYKINQELVDNSGNPAPRNYVQTGVIVSPATGIAAVDLVGAYGEDTGGNKTVGTSQTSGSLPSNWNCAENSGTAAATRAATASTLLFGFSSWPANPNSQLNGVQVGLQPMRRQLTMTGKQGDNIYSQIWYSFNPAYLSPTGVLNGATFTGSVGATFKGTTSGTSLTITDPPTDGILSVGDTITYSCTGGCSGTGSATIASVVTTNVAYTLTNSAGGNVSNKAMTAASSILNVSSVASGQISAGDVLDIAGDPTVSLGGSGTGLTGTYTISGSKTTMASGTRQSSGTNIQAAGGTEIPAEGTAIQTTTTTLFDAANLVGSINGTTLTVSSLTAGHSLYVGDALFGPNVLPNTFITQQVSGTSNGVGTYTVCRLVDGASPSCQSHPSMTASDVIARAAVRGANSSATAPTASTFTISRRPTSSLSGQLCGGVCAMLNNGSSTTFTLANITTGDDWASGFACVYGVDPSSIKTLGTVSTRRTSWREIVN